MTDAASRRAISLVVLADGDVLGVSEPFPASPWWQEVTEISERHPWLATLRLLEAKVPPGASSGGEVTYLVEPLEESPDRAVRSLGPLRRWPGTLHEDSRRMSWAAAGGPAADLAWAATHVTFAGRPVQRRTWNLSSIWSIPTTAGIVWLKCVPPFFAHEVGVLEALAGRGVPDVLAADGNRALLRALPGADGYHASLPERLALVDLLVELQLELAGDESRLLELGVPDGRWPSLLAASGAVIARRAPESAELYALLDTAAARIDRIEACGLPSVLVHGDAHPGNARIGEGTGRGIWFDWGDSKVAHPVLDLEVLDRPGTLDAVAVRRHWLAVWKREIPESDPLRAWTLAKPLAALAVAVVYQGFLDAIESTERIYHEGDVLPALARAARLAAVERSPW